MKLRNLTPRPVAARACSGFTLVELLLVLVILGILAGIVVPKFAGTGERARKQAAAAQLNVFATALDLFEVDNGSYPRGKDGLQALVVKPRDASPAWHQYLESVPLDPWQHPYVYECPGKHRPTSYDLMSMGPDGRVGGDDDIVNWEVRTR
jgi:general secretion pathway protein G